MTWLDPILSAVVQASALCRHIQREFLNVREKAGAEPVTIADYGSQALLCRAIADAYPRDAIIAEESGTVFAEIVPAEQQTLIAGLLGELLGEPISIDQIIGWLNHGQQVQAARTWVIDPIDGTKGFIDGRHYSIAVGVVEAGNPDPIAGILGTPEYPFAAPDGTIFYAEGGRSYARPLGGTQDTPIQVSAHGIEAASLLESVEPEHTDRARLQAVYAAAGLSHAAITRLDGQDKYAAVACGDNDLYVRIPGKAGWRHKVWDHAAGVALVQAAGGRVTDLDGKGLDFSQGRVLPNQGMIISNGQIHDRVVAAIAQAERHF